MEGNNKITRVQLSLYAQRLPNVAGAFKGVSDPYAIVTLLAGDPRDKPKVVGQTEVIKNSLSPRWTTTFTLDYEFGKPTRVNVGIFDEIRKAASHKSMGSACFELGEVLGSRGGIKAKRLKNGGTLFARVEKAPEQFAGSLSLSIRGIGLKNVDGLFSKSDPFFELSRHVQMPGGGSSWQPIYRSKHIKNDLNPVWETASLDVNQLCGGDLNKPILIAVWDWEKSGRHETMGSFETTVNGLMRAVTPGSTGRAKDVSTKNAFHLKRNGKDFGMIVVSSASITGGSNQQRIAQPPSDAPFSMALGPSPAQSQQPPVHRPIASAPPAPVPTPTAPQMLYRAPPSRKPKFIDYIAGGCELQMAVAIDFTGSNGDPRRPGTLHYVHRDGQLNDYEKAISAVGSIVAKYDSDNRFPVYGFGAKYGGVVKHCFQVGRNPEASGIAGILEAYRGIFRTGLIMSGPTLFAEVVAVAAAQARSAQESAKRIGKQAYSILLILTDGAVSDVVGTKRAISAASDAPLSIVIVGIGNADFSAMQFLDDFQTQEGVGRDICQFVEFSRHASNKISLTQATLDEIPDQLVEYFYPRGIMPLPAITGSKVNVLEEDYNEDVDIDLSLEYNSEGEICLPPNEGFYDDTGYGTYSTYAGLTVLPPPTNPALHGGPQQPPIAGAPVPSPMFYVQVPRGVSAGMQLQVKNPSTGQDMIVTVPHGVAEGGKFAVAT